jgi:outer membrane protein assembly factor BamD (BamD/ComL family)
MMSRTLSYYRTAASYLHGETSKAVGLIDRYIKKYGLDAKPKKDPKEMMYLIMNIDRAGFGVLEEEIF